jgi:hypothetical protein
VAWITDAELKKALAAALGQVGPGDLASHWTPIVAWANRQAYYAVRARLMGRGFTSDQVDDWEQREEFNERLGVCMAIKRAAMRGEQVNLQAAADDCKEALEELATVAVVIDGELTGSGRVTTGEFTTSSDRFLLTEPDGDGLWEEGDGTKL